MSFALKLDPKKRVAGRFIGRVRDELVRAFLDAKKERGLTQAALAADLGVDRSRVTRLLKGDDNLTLRSVAEMACALDRELVFSLRKPTNKSGQNTNSVIHRQMGSSSDWPTKEIRKARKIEEVAL